MLSLQVLYSHVLGFIPSNHNIYIDWKMLIRDHVRLQYLLSCLVEDRRILRR